VSLRQYHKEETTDNKQNLEKNKKSGRRKDGLGKKATDLGTCSGSVKKDEGKQHI
jgi:hypothetical protein